MTDQELNFIQAILKEIRDLISGYMVQVNTFELGVVQNLRDEVAVISTQLADQYGDIVEELNKKKSEYAQKLRLRHLERWNIYQMDNQELNPDGKISSSVAKDKARYQSIIDCYPLTGPIHKLEGLQERANALWRYTLPKLQDSIASRLALIAKYPDGLPSNILPAVARQKSNFDELFDDLDKDITEADKNIEGLRRPAEEEIIPDNTEFEETESSTGYWDTND